MCERINTRTLLRTTTIYLLLISGTVVFAIFCLSFSWSLSPQPSSSQRQERTQPPTNFCSLGSLRGLMRPEVQMADHSRRLFLLAAPKGGATVAAQLMLRQLDLLDTAKEYNPWIHKYRKQVFLHQPDHEPIDCQETCHTQGWTCIKIVRSPVDRLISSFIHVMRAKINFPELQQVATSYQTQVQASSFHMFIEALERRAADFRRSSYECSQD